VAVPREDKSDDGKDSIHEKIQKIYGHFGKYHMRILLADFNATLRRGDIFKTDNLA
jgi:lipoate synthase